MDRGGDAAQRGAAAAAAGETGDTGQQDTATAAASRGVKREPGRAAGQQAPATEENWSALSNLRVAGGAESGEEAPTQPGSTGSSASSNRHKVRRTSSSAHPSTPQDDGSFSKSSLSFILDDQAASAAAAGGDGFTSGGKRAAALITRSRSTGDLTGEAVAAGTSGRASRKQGADGKRRARRPPSRICKHENCEQYVVDQGLVANGARLRAAPVERNTKDVAGSTKHGLILALSVLFRARTGGSTECKVPSCINRAKSRGFCWSHGGGTKCKTDKCEKIAISNGLCWAHGGGTSSAPPCWAAKERNSWLDCLVSGSLAGKRCAVESCMRQAYERTDNLCNNHYHERQHDTTVVVEGEAGEGVAGTSSLHPDDEEKPPADQ
ncbi:hypothetical protein PHYPSEUDO_006569 [Phytophthora pseudosyringae]|uniref:WRKY19-like zinc finger domain-containing protein n=1 Tax=Phytophthora pseudosyringae TaxID=221518 RepID=A0A8T1VID4_9STRA|nr:hypothetical protein PHYPSEUDO_006569 [Phytophthora pseudosyringae]